MLKRRNFIEINKAAISIVYRTAKFFLNSVSKIKKRTLFLKDPCTHFNTNTCKYCAETIKLRNVMALID